MFVIGSNNSTGESPCVTPSEHVSSSNKATATRLNIQPPRIPPATLPKPIGRDLKPSELNKKVRKSAGGPVSRNRNLFESVLGKTENENVGPLHLAEGKSTCISKTLPGQYKFLIKLRAFKILQVFFFFSFFFFVSPMIEYLVYRM